VTGVLQSHIALAIGIESIQVMLVGTEVVVPVKIDFRACVVIKEIHLPATRPWQNLNFSQFGLLQGIL
jgi:hypothetical protein